MTSELLEQANTLHKQVQQLAVEIKSMRKDRDTLKSELETAQRKLDKVYAQNRSLQTLLDGGLLSQVLMPKEETGELRVRLNKMVKELDTVIHYLEKT